MDVLRGNNRWGDDMQDDLISRQAAIDDAHRQIWYRMNPSMKERIDEWLKKLPSAQPEGISLEWIDKHLEWRDNCDNDFAQLAKVSIRGMVEIWRKEIKNE